jgi:hypothetical protein
MIKTRKTGSSYRNSLFSLFNSGQCLDAIEANFGLRASFYASFALTLAMTVAVAARELAQCVYGRSRYHQAL